MDYFGRIGEDELNTKLALEISQQIAEKNVFQSTLQAIARRHLVIHRMMRITSITATCGLFAICVYEKYYEIKDSKVCSMLRFACEYIAIISFAFMTFSK